MAWQTEMLKGGFTVKTKFCRKAESEWTATEGA
jgi:hypothetical protein